MPTIHFVQDGATKATLETSVIPKAGEYVQVPGIGNGEWAFEVEHVVLKFTEKNDVEVKVILGNNSESA